MEEAAAVEAAAASSDTYKCRLVCFIRCRSVASVLDQQETTSNSLVIVMAAHLHSACIAMHYVNGYSHYKRMCLSFMVKR